MWKNKGSALVSTQDSYVGPPFLQCPKKELGALVLRPVPLFEHGSCCSWDPPHFPHSLSSPTNIHLPKPVICGGPYHLCGRETKQEEPTQASRDPKAQSCTKELRENYIWSTWETSWIIPRLPTGPSFCQKPAVWLESFMWSGKSGSEPDLRAGIKSLQLVMFYVDVQLKLQGLPWQRRHHGDSEHPSPALSAKSSRKGIELSWRQDLGNTSCPYSLGNHVD